MPCQHDSLVAPHTKPLVCAPPASAAPWQLDCAVQVACPGTTEEILAALYPAGGVAARSKREGYGDQCSVREALHHHWRRSRWERW
jgi:hypothetical protein